MAVQKSKKSRSRRGMRRSHDQVTFPTLSKTNIAGQESIHIRHHLDEETGAYRQHQLKSDQADEEDEKD